MDEMYKVSGVDQGRKHLENPEILNLSLKSKKLSLVWDHT